MKVFFGDVRVDEFEKHDAYSGKSNVKRDIMYISEKIKKARKELDKLNTELKQLCEFYSNLK